MAQEGQDIIDIGDLVDIVASTGNMYAGRITEMDDGRITIDMNDGLIMFNDTAWVTMTKKKVKNGEKKD